MAQAVPRRTGVGGKSPYYQERGSSSSRGYDSTYRKAREVKISLRPLCEVCDSRGGTTPAVETHHVEKVRDRRDLAAHVSNLVAVCKLCHVEIEGLSWAELDKRYGIKPTAVFEGW